MEKLEKELKRPKSPKSLSDVARKSLENQEMLQTKKVNMINFEDPEKKLMDQLLMYSEEVEEFDPGYKYGVFLPDELETGRTFLDNRPEEEVEEDPTSYPNFLKGPPPNMFRNIEKNTQRIKEALVPQKKKPKCLFCSGKLEPNFDPLVRI